MASWWRPRGVHRGSTAGPGGGCRGAKTAGTTPTTGCATPPGGVGVERRTEMHLIVAPSLRNENDLQNVGKIPRFRPAGPCRRVPCALFLDYLYVQCTVSYSSTYDSTTVYSSVSATIRYDTYCTYHTYTTGAACCTICCTVVVLLYAHTVFMLCVSAAPGKTVRRRRRQGRGH